MRIADKMNYEQVKSNLAKNRTEMADLQNQSATMKRVNKPSDDPLAATRVLQAKTEVASGQQYLKSVNQAKTFLEYSDQSLSELSELLNRAKELAIAQSNDASTNIASRQASASEIDQLFSQAVQIGNRKLADRFLFGGFRTTRPPFSFDGKYHGDSGEIKISIQKEGAIAMNIPGDRVFLGKNLKAPSVAGPEDAFDFEGNEKSRESTELDVDELQSGKLGKSNKMREPSSIPATGNSLKKGTDSEEVQGLSSSWSTSGVNIFNVLRDLATSLRANDKQGVQESLDQIDEALGQVVLSRAQVGSRVSTLTSAGETLQKVQVDAKTMQSSLEDADTFELVSDMNKTESTLKAALATSGKLIQPSLLDFLR